MKKSIFKLVLLSVLFFEMIGTVFACSMFIATKGATQDGSVIVAYSDDNELGDQRIVYVPAANHKSNSKRPVYPFKEDYPRYEVATLIRTQRLK